MNIPLYELVKIFKALGDPTRVRILKLLLKQKSLCVCEIMQALDIPQARASRHLGILKDAGFLKDERHGLWVHYSIEDDSPDSCCESIGELLSNWLEQDPLVREDEQRLRRSVRLGEKTGRRG